MTKNVKKPTKNPPILFNSKQNELFHIIFTEAEKGYIEGATTRLCIPAKKSAIRVMQLMVKKG